MNISILLGFVTFLGALYVVAGGAELKIEVLHKPDKCTETVAESGQNLMVHYTGRYLDGKKFDSSFDRGHPYGPFQLGNGDVILGYDRGLPGMCVGEKRRLTIPPHLAYGERGYPDVIPPSSTLVFDVELLSIEPAPMSHDEV